MRKILNKTNKPLRVHLSRGKVLHLGPRKEGQISDPDIEHQGVLTLVESGEIEILSDGAGGGGSGRAGDAVHEDTHGHHPDTSTRRRGDR